MENVEEEQKTITDKKEEYKRAYLLEKEKKNKNKGSALTQNKYNLDVKASKNRKEYNKLVYQLRKKESINQTEESTSQPEELQEELQEEKRENKYNLGVKSSENKKEYDRLLYQLKKEEKLQKFKEHYEKNAEIIKEKAIKTQKKYRETFKIVKDIYENGLSLTEEHKQRITDIFSV